jgi:hypothetical protein
MQGVFIPQIMFKVANKGLVVSGSLKSGVLKLGMILEIDKISVPLLGLEVLNKKIEEIKGGEEFAGQLGIILPEIAEKVIAKNINQEIIFKETN